MREVAATGDLTRKIVLRRGNRWDDEDARLLATTFNTLTDSIARFQREMSQKERLSSLGRLSTVIAHEVRNPLMIIKAALHTLRQPRRRAATRCAKRPPTSTRKSARLNRIVNEVLDFARPIRFELAPADLNALCRESAAAAQAAGPAPAIALRPRSVARRRSPPTPSGCGSRWSTCSSTPGTRSNGSGGAAAVAARRRSTTAARRSRPHHGRRPAASASPPPTCRTSSIRTSRPSAAAPASACRSPRTSSKGSAARSRSSSAPGRGTEIRDRASRSTPPQARVRQHDDATAAPSSSSTTRRRS